MPPELHAGFPERAGDVSVWRPTADGELPSEAGLPVVRTVLRPLDAKAEECFLSLFFKGRYKILESPMPSKADLAAAKKVVPDVHMEDEAGSSQRYHLVARRIYATGKQVFGNKERTVRWFYVRSPSREALERELESIADFAGMPNPRKLVARLELLMGGMREHRALTIYPLHFRLGKEWISPITNSPMEDGCGFIGRDLLCMIVGESEGRTALALQVRVVVPDKGIFKGELAVHPRLGFRAELTPSMRKVLPSTKKHQKDKGWIMIKQVHPSKPNRQRGGRMMRSTDDGLPCIPRLPSDRKMSDMMKQLLTHLGVPETRLDRYVERDTCQDAYVVGLADPTRALPRGHVFLTGLKDVKKVFITRAPCVLPEDGRIFPVTHSRPEDMKEKDWEWLQTLPFGAVIFSGKGSQPLPLLLADGDLDGDLFFVLWGSILVDHISKAKPVPKGHGAAVCNTPGAEAPQRRTREWLKSAQDHMIDADVLRDCLEIGKYYRFWEESVVNLGMDHADSRAWAEAYKLSLDRPKHGNDIQLPPHLQELWAPSKKKRKPSGQAVPPKPSQMQRTAQISAEALLQMSWSELRDLNRELALGVSLKVGGPLGRNLQSVVQDMWSALKERGQLSTTKTKAQTEAQKESQQLVLSLCSVAYSPGMDAARFILTCHGKTARLLGGHADVRARQGCNWLVECMCDGCEDRELRYLEHGGRVLTLEEFYEHSGGSQKNTRRAVWRTDITVSHESSPAKQVQLESWIKARSHHLYDELKEDGFVMVYWPGERTWFKALITGICDDTKACRLLYIDDSSEEREVCLAGELVCEPGAEPDPEDRSFMATVQSKARNTPTRKIATVATAGLGPQPPALRSPNHRKAGAAVVARGGPSTSAKPGATRARTPPRTSAAAAATATASVRGTEMPRLSSRVAEELPEEERHLCSVVSKLIDPNALLICNGLPARFLGGHAKVVKAQGCNYLALCLCKECEGKPLCYPENGGRLLTLEELYEHATKQDVQAAGGKQAWQKAISMCNASSGEAVPLGQWLVEHSRQLYNGKLGPLCDGQLQPNRDERRLRLYWPGNRQWFDAQIVSFNEKSGICTVKYDDDGAEEPQVCLAGEILSWHGEVCPDPGAPCRLSVLSKPAPLGWEALASPQARPRRSPASRPATAPPTTPRIASNSMSHQYVSACEKDSSVLSPAIVRREAATTVLSDVGSPSPLAWRPTQQGLDMVAAGGDGGWGQMECAAGSGSTPTSEEAEMGAHLDMGPTIERTALGQSGIRQAGPPATAEAPFRGISFGHHSGRPQPVHAAAARYTQAPFAAQPSELEPAVLGEVRAPRHRRAVPLEGAALAPDDPVLVMRMNGELLQLTGLMKQRGLLTSAEANRFIIHWQMHLDGVRRMLLLQTLRVLWDGSDGEGGGSSEDGKAAAEMVKGVIQAHDTPQS